MNQFSATTLARDLAAIDNWRNRYAEALPAEDRADTENRPRQVRGVAYSRVRPTPVAAPRLLAWSEEMGALLGLARPAPTGPAVEVLGGNRVLPGMQPFAARYGGHQFGNWAGQLGDGRAITLAEIEGADGLLYELQLKGAGLTPYSRTADGRAVLRSSLREFLCSEAMHHLGVPTTRALSLVGTGEPVVRDMFYDGRPAAEPGAIVCRVAPSFLRFGNFEILAAQEEPQLLRRLADFVIRTHYPGLGDPSPEVYAAWFAEICRRTAVMVCEWMRVGFVHGVMNTDNMSILGLTIDYGPYGWLEGYEPDWTPNTTDLPGRRYAFGSQPRIAHWNLVRLANALYGLMEGTDPLERGLAVYADTVEQGSARMLAAKLGLSEIGRDGDGELVGDLFKLLQASETDYTLFFRLLARVPGRSAAERRGLLAPAFYDESVLQGAHGEGVLAWLARWEVRLGAEALPVAESCAAMDRVNPLYVPRNYLAQLAIDALEQGDAAPLERLMQVLRRPYEEQPGAGDLALRRPEWARERPGCSALSCSS